MGQLPDDIRVVRVVRETESGGVMVKCPYCWGEHAHENKGIVMANCLGGRYNIVDQRRRSSAKDGSDTSDVKDKLIHLAARILTTCQMSEFKEDNPKTTPQTVLDRITWNNNRIKAIAAEIRQIADSI